jgi:Mn2+/Fe2+ NRAMP family transporter
LNKKNKGVKKMRKFFKKIRQNQDYQGIALALSALLGWPVLWLGVLAVCVLFAVVSGWIVSVL